MCYKGSQNLRLAVSTMSMDGSGGNYTRLVNNSTRLELEVLGLSHEIRVGWEYRCESIGGERLLFISVLARAKEKAGTWKALVPYEWH